MFECFVFFFTNSSLFRLVIMLYLCMSINIYRYFRYFSYICIYFSFIHFLLGVIDLNLDPLGTTPIDAFFSIASFSFGIGPQARWALRRDKVAF